MKLLIPLIAIALLAACDRSPKTPTSSAKPAPSAQELELGERTYKQVCNACHGTGAAGAPKLGAADQWQARIRQGHETLYQHAVNGFTGSHGTMPARGGRPDLGDAEVRAAVDYMLSRVAPN